MNRASLVIILVCVAFLCLFVFTQGTTMNPPIYLSVNEPEKHSHYQSGAPLPIDPDSIFVSELSYVTIAYHGESLFTAFCRSAIVSEDNARIRYIMVVPQRSLSSFDDAVARVSDIVDSLGLQNERKISERINKWKSEPRPHSTIGTRSTGAGLRPNLSLFIEIKPLRAFGPDKDWFVALTFTTHYGKDSETDGEGDNPVESKNAAED